MTLPYTYDDGGRLAAGFKGDTGDCVTRAITIATGLPYREVYDALAERMEGRKVGRRGAKRPSKRTAREGVLRKVYEPYLIEHGWFWTPTMHIGSGCTVHLTDGELPMDSRLIVALSKHMSAVIDGIIRDTHDPGRDGTRCVYGYYQRG